MKHAITFSFDDNYRAYADGLIKSVTTYAPEIDVYARYIPNDPKNTYECDLPNVTIITEYISLSQKRDKFKSFPNDFHLDLKSIANYQRLLASDHMIYTNHSKFENIKELLDDGYDYIISVNCDFLFTGDPSQLIEDTLSIYTTQQSPCVFANFETEHPSLKPVTDVGEPITVTTTQSEIQKPGDDDFFIIIGNNKSVRQAFRNITIDLNIENNPTWNDDGTSFAKHVNKCKDIDLHITPIVPFTSCCLINLDHLYTTPIELFKRYPEVRQEIKCFYDDDTQLLDIQVHEEFFNKLKHINPDLYLPRHPRGHDPESGNKWDFFEEEIFIHIRKSCGFLYYAILGGRIPSMENILIRKVPEFEDKRTEVNEWYKFLYDVVL